MWDWNLEFQHALGVCAFASKHNPKLFAQTPEVSAVIDALATSEDLARRAHRGLFEYGDPGDDDEDDAPPRPAWGRR